LIFCSEICSEVDKFAAIFLAPRCNKQRERDEKEEEKKRKGEKMCKNKEEKGKIKGKYKIHGENIL
jgi:hypothetical protein